MSFTKRIRCAAPREHVAQRICSATPSLSQRSSDNQPASSFYRVSRELLRSAPRVRCFQVFLGVRLQCTHVIIIRSTTRDSTRLPRPDGLFARVQHRIVDNKRRDKFDQHEFDGEQVVWWIIPLNGRIREPAITSASPNFWVRRRLLLSAKDDDRLLALADWIAKPANPFFKKAR